MHRTSQRLSSKLEEEMKLRTISMKNLGLTEEWIQESTIYKDLFIGRVSTQSKNLFKVITENGEIMAEISGKFHYSIKDHSQYPTVGDFVMVDRTDDSRGNGMIHHILTRKSVFARKVAGSKKNFRLSLPILIPFLSVCP